MRTQTRGKAANAMPLGPRRRQILQVTSSTALTDAHAPGHPPATGPRPPTMFPDRNMPEAQKPHLAAIHTLTHVAVPQRHVAPPQRRDGPAGDPASAPRCIIPPARVRATWQVACWLRLPELRNSGTGLSTCLQSSARDRRGTPACDSSSRHHLELHRRGIHFTLAAPRCSMSAWKTCAGQFRGSGAASRSTRAFAGV